MKTVILAGGLGTRLAEETGLKPKPMVEIGGHPILWHILQIYAAHSYRRFIIAGGYKVELIKEYFRNYRLVNSDFRVHLPSGQTEIVHSDCPDWEVGIFGTGLHTLTGGRLRRLRDQLNEPFMVTYGDGVGDVDIPKLVEFHQSHGGLATLTAVRPPARFGSVNIERDGRVREFSEKRPSSEGWINGGFFVFDPPALDYIEGDAVSLEADVLPRIAAAGHLRAYRHEGFWQCMDTLRDKQSLETLWASGQAPWKVWA